MPFGLVDDKLHSHVKWRTATKGARALWTTAKSWCMDQLTDGFVPKGMLRSLDGTPGDARSLVQVGLWETADGGWQFHDWLDYQPDAASIRAKRDKESVGGLRGNHTRWHAKRGIHVEGCEFCESGTRSGTREVPDSGGDSGANPPSPRPIPSTNSSKRDTGTPRNARDEDLPPGTPEPQPEIRNISAVLQAAGLPEREHRAFLVDLKDSGARSTTALVNDLHRKGKLPGRIAEWRTERDLATEAKARPSGKRTTSDKVRDGIALAERLAAEEAAQSNVVHLRQQIEGA